MCQCGLNCYREDREGDTVLYNEAHLLCVDHDVAPVLQSGDSEQREHRPTSLVFSQIRLVFLALVWFLLFLGVWGAGAGWAGVVCVCAWHFAECCGSFCLHSGAAFVLYCFVLFWFYSERRKTNKLDERVGRLVCHKRPLALTWPRRQN